MNAHLRNQPRFDEGSKRALSGFYTRMTATLARELDEAPDPWVREAIGDWLREFLREAAGWKQPSAKDRAHAPHAEAR